ncbi:hypothetical protein C8R46DRAFT_431335 [Mycena filopes]|nr:hypothetical protein C8R46DRAFT_431335 [Mycena filopes]
MTLTLRRASNTDRVLQYGTVAATLLKDIGNASNQPYLQAIASISLLIMENVKRVKDNKDECMKLTQRAVELVGAIINICGDSEADLAPAMIRSITQFSETLEKILTFVRNQVKGGFWRRVFRSMEDADLIVECNAGLKHALDVFGVQSSIIAAMTMGAMQKEQKQYYDELIAILKEKRSRPKRSSSGGSSDRSSPRKKRPTSAKIDERSPIAMLPASPKIFYGRDEEVAHIINTITRSTSASAPRISVCGAEGIGKTAVALAALHSAELTAHFTDQRYFVNCDGASDSKQLVAVLASHFGLQSGGGGKKRVVRHLTALATEASPVLLVLDALERAWKPHENRNDVEDLLSLLADSQYLTLIVTVRGGERPRQVRWTRPFLPTLHPLPPAAARQTFLDISDVSPSSEPQLDALLELAANNPGALTHLAGLASFEGCASLVSRWESEGPALLLDRAARKKPVYVSGEVFTDEPEEIGDRVPTVVAEKDILALLEMGCEREGVREPMPTIDSVLVRWPSREGTLASRASSSSMGSVASVGSMSVGSVGSRASTGSVGSSRASTTGTLVEVGT